MIEKLNDLVEHEESKGIKVNFVTNKELHDYAGMNPQAAEVMGYDDIEHDEILIDGRLSLEQQVANLRHEIIEKNLMKAGMKYYPAHVIALRLEDVDLSGKELDMLDKIGIYAIEKIGKDNIKVNSEGKVYNINKKEKSKEMYVMPDEEPKSNVKPKKAKRFKNIVKSFTMQ